jgi:deoxyribodipyrimidine photo-lyase
MRAMLVSFAAYDLFLDWRLFAHFLAQQFLDYEPGIHYPQIQMQSGTTGINTIRIYDPVKQGYDHDPHGEFVRAWVPELAHIPNKLVHEPWKLSPLELQEYRCTSHPPYPEPVVNHKEAVRQAKQVVRNFRAKVETKISAKETLNRHGSRARPQARKKRLTAQASRRPAPIAIQGNLFDSIEER